MNARRVAHVLGWILLFLAGAMALPWLVAVLQRSGDAGVLAASAGWTALAGGLLLLATRSGKGELTIREGFAVVALGWVFIAAFGALPFRLSGHAGTWIDALFESMSGFTTTGASILTSPESLSAGVAFWRCFMQWIGGLGIVLFGLAILPMLGVGGLHLFKAETPGPTSEKFTPRLSDTAKRLWMIYAGLTLAEVLLLLLGGMGLLDALAHSFATMATGGFSTRNLSLGHWDSPYLHLVVTLFMFLAGINFVLYHRLLRDRKLGVFWQDPEWRSYAGIAGAAALAFWLMLITAHDRPWGQALVDSLFQTVSVMTTTGFATDDFNQWHSLGRVGLLGLMVVGGMAGSTGGGVKVVRIRVLAASARLTLRRLISPRAVLFVRLGGHPVPHDLVASIHGFFVLFLAQLALGTLVLALCGHDLEVCLSGTLACLSNIGPGLGEVGPMGNFAAIHPAAKLTLTWLMLLGRLELFTILVMFSVHYWKR